MKFPLNEDIKVRVSTLCHAGYFNPSQAKEDYVNYLESGDKEDLFFYTDVDEGLQQFRGNGYMAQAEEWFGGFGDTRELAMSAFVKIQSENQSEDEDDKWEDD